jgi:hypothetical protein
MRNTSLTEFASSARRHQLVSFNELPHLDTHRMQRLALTPEKHGGATGARR